MTDDLEYPTNEAIDSVLRKIGVDPTTRYNKKDQDTEYTTCRLDEIDKYVDLYGVPTTTEPEKRVLGHYFLECLNEHTQTTDRQHPTQSRVFEILHRDKHIHKSAMEYWTDTSDPDEENWWPITRYIFEWRSEREKGER